MSTPRLTQLFQRLVQPERQTRAARSVEVFGRLDLVLGVLMLAAPDWVAALLSLPALSNQGANYLRLAGLLVSGLGMLYIVSGRLNAEGFVFASLLDRPLVPVVMAILWRLNILPGALAFAFALTDFGGFLWTLAAWRADARYGNASPPPNLFTQIVTDLFAFSSGVLRNARTFHPDGRVFRGTVRSLHPKDIALSRAAERLAGAVLLRVGMGLMKKGMPRWLADRIPDAPSMAVRFFSASAPGEVRLQRRSGEDLDLLCTAGGDRLWKLVLNLLTGGKGHGLHSFNYFNNIYSADVPFRIDGSTLEVWLRLAPDLSPSGLPLRVYRDGMGREQGLSEAVAHRAVVRVEAQCCGDAHDPFIPIAEIRFEEEIQIDQETLHFDPVAGRGFTPFGFLTELRKSVYTASVQSRGSTQQERVQREQEGFLARLAGFFGPAPNIPQETDDAQATDLAAVASNACARRLWRWIGFFAVFAILGMGLVLAARLTTDRPVDYTDDLLHFKHGSTGGERLNGIPYWFWVALPELFPEYLPDKTPGQGYTAFGMIYEKGEDPRYALPVGVSMRKVRGIDVVYLNCAVCHTGTVRDAPGGLPRVIAGMPANTFNLGAWGRFLTDVPLDQKFTPQRILDQILVMQNDPHRVVDKPDLINQLIFRYAAVYLMRDSLLVLRQRLAFIDTKTWGPGRVDTFNAPKALLNFPMDHADPAELMGNVDFPSIWNQGPRKGMQLHWDGNNTSVDERNLSAAFGTGAYPPTLDTERVLRTAKWLETAQPPPYPYSVDLALAERGQPIYQHLCAGCHGLREAPFRHSPPQAEERVGTVVPIAAIGTDRWRLDSYTWLLAVNQSTLYAGYEKDWGFTKPYPQRFTHFRKTQGYANSPLDGLWLRAPYLHNGSVPNLRELLEPEGSRRKLFYRGNDVYDRQNVGFISDVPEAGNRRFFAFDTAQRGNGNGGHEGARYGTDLARDEKRALIEYLKTF